MFGQRKNQESQFNDRGGGGGNGHARPRLIVGDALDVIPRLALEGVAVDMIFCSPNPLFYYMKEHMTRGIGSEHTPQTYLDHLIGILTKARLILKDTGSLWVHMMDTHMINGSMLQIPERFAIMMTDKAGWKLRGKRAWLRGPHEITKGSTAAISLCPWDWEPVYWFTKKEKGYTFNADSRYAKTSIITNAPYYSNVVGLPPKVMIECMDLTTKMGDTVMDCFMGGGGTGVAATHMGRKFIGIELSADKVSLASRRLALSYAH